MEHEIEKSELVVPIGEPRTTMGGGVIFKWLATGKETNGQFSMFEAQGIPGMEPPPHRHTNEDEAFYILEGELLFTIGEEEIKAKKGDFVFLPRHITHQFKVLSKEFRCLASIYPAGLEHYLHQLSMPCEEGAIPPLVQEPPSEEAMKFMAHLNEKFGVDYSG